MAKLTPTTEPILHADEARSDPRDSQWTRAELEQVVRVGGPPVAINMIPSAVEPVDLPPSDRPVAITPSPE